MKQEKKPQKTNVRHLLRDIFLMIIGALCAAVGLECFLVPNQLLDGGVTGISLLVADLTGWNLPLLILLINVPFIFLGYRQVSKQFALKAFCAILGLVLLLQFTHFPIITHEKLLISVFGGFFLGAGIGFAMRGGGVLDGTEVLALYLSRKIKFMQIGELILVINIVIFSIAAFVFDIEIALYSILTYMAASKTVDFITQGIEEYTAVTIVSEKNEQIRKAIIKNLDRGVTIYKGKRGLTGKKANLDGMNDIDIIVTVVTKLEMSKLRDVVDEIDDSAFLTTHSIGSAKGGMVKKRALH
ncbi:MAG TPA: YitT family protein [Flavobacteriales bacterium]|nr:YitT family protein [Flavobacteriales bacterium]